ncbi:hypothetical protein Pst134EB_027226 [Puccinia striiformis f. sp. tritici]|nr:hypothetical protein Pst134EB_027226 [Puccinia striiformis f. sp. tritici]
MASPSSVVKPFTDAHRIYVQRLYRRALKQSLDWVVFRDIWRQKAIEIRVKFERNRDVRDPRAVKKLLHEAEVQLAETEHPDPYRREQIVHLSSSHTLPTLVPPFFSFLRCY